MFTDKIVKHTTFTNSYYGEFSVINLIKICIEIVSVICVTNDYGYVLLVDSISRSFSHSPGL